MARKAVEVRVCDRCASEPAQNWVIVGPGGTTREIDLCQQHGGPVANAFALGRPAATRPPKRARARVVAPESPTVASPPEPVWR